MAQLDIREFLVEQGYPVQDRGEYITIPAKWRGGEDVSSVAIYPKTNVVIDFVSSERMRIEELVGKILGIASRFDLKQWMAKRGMELVGQKKLGSIINVRRPFPESVLEDFKPDYSYFLGRGISEETLRTFEGGLCLAGRMKDRFCFPVRDSRRRIIGLVGRAVVDGMLPKYKILGKKASFVWPAIVNLPQIKEAGEIILVESPACVFRLWDFDIRHVLCLFGTELSVALLNFAIKMNPRRIIVATNNEASLVGNEAAQKVTRKFRRFFDHHQVLVHLPIGAKDFADMSRGQIKEWRSRI